MPSQSNFRAKYLAVLSMVLEVVTSTNCHYSQVAHPSLLLYKAESLKAVGKTQLLTILLLLDCILEEIS